MLYFFILLFLFTSSRCERRFEFESQFDLSNITSFIINQLQASGRQGPTDEENLAKEINHLRKRERYFKLIERERDRLSERGSVLERDRDTLGGRGGMAIERERGTLNGRGSLLQQVANHHKVHIYGKHHSEPQNK